MVVKVTMVLLLLAVILALCVLAAYRYFDNQAERNHEKEMLREKRDAELLTEHEWDDSIDRELEKERNS